MAREALWKKITFTAAMTVSVKLYRLTGGAVGGTVAGTPVLLLTTVGRRTGRERTRPVVYGTDGDRLVVIAAAGGSDHHPAWWLNLRHAGHGVVQVGSDVFAVDAHEAHGRERERLWRRMVEVYPDYFNYAARTSRTMPIVVLERSAERVRSDQPSA